MPELPEVETTRRGIEPALLGKRIAGLDVRESRLRWPVPESLGALLEGQQVMQVGRRGKYLLLGLERGTVLVHLGMSGSLRVLPAGSASARRKHDHIDLRMDDGMLLRYHDPRRFGAWLWLAGDPLQHALLRDLGPEPLDNGFDGAYLFAKSRNRRVAVKPFLMDGRVVVGVGNIYANEALFRAGIHPARQAGRVSLQRYGVLARVVREVLAAAITQGGTTLRDYVGGDGVPGYFSQRLDVYGRAGMPCPVCAAPVRVTRSGQRATFHCATCQH